MRRLPIYGRQHAQKVNTGSFWGRKPVSIGAGRWHVISPDITVNLIKRHAYPIAAARSNYGVRWTATRNTRTVRSSRRAAECRNPTEWAHALSAQGGDLP